tara:strand:+ start:4467 stop:4613 length:147 start_codon:yes stop_codon:yes gene_type:complete
MSTLHHESILESLYEDVMQEATETGNLAMMSQEDIQIEILRRFEDLCQ